MYIHTYECIPVHVVADLRTEAIVQKLHWTPSGASPAYISDIERIWQHSSPTPRLHEWDGKPTDLVTMGYTLTTAGVSGVLPDKHVEDHDRLLGLDSSLHVRAATALALPIARAVAKAAGGWMGMEDVPVKKVKAASASDACSPVAAGSAVNIIISVESPDAGTRAIPAKEILPSPRMGFFKRQLWCVVNVTPSIVVAVIEPFVVDEGSYRLSARSTVIASKHTPEIHTDTRSCTGTCAFTAHVYTHAYSSTCRRISCVLQLRFVFAHTLPVCMWTLKCIARATPWHGRRCAVFYVMR
jgi:hypothetical protein